MSREIMQQALDALENPHSGWIQREKNARKALRQALAQPEQAHTDHPMRHWDRTCPACVAEPWDTSDMAYRPNGLSVEQEPVAWQVMVENEPMKEFSIKDVAHDWAVTEKLNGSKYSYWIRPLYTAPISEPVKERISEPLANQEPVDRQTLIDCVAGSIIYHFDMSLLQKKVLATAEYIVDHYTAPPSKQDVNQELVEVAEMAAGIGIHTLPDRMKCRCSQCDMVNLARSILNKHKEQA